MGYALSNYRAGYSHKDFELAFDEQFQGYSDNLVKAAKEFAGICDTVWDSYSFEDRCDVVEEYLDAKLAF